MQKKLVAILKNNMTLEQFTEKFFTKDNNGNYLDARNNPIDLFSIRCMYNEYYGDGVIDINNISK